MSIQRQHEDIVLAPLRIFSLYARGHNLGLTVTICAAATLASVLAGSTLIPLPWATGSQNLAVSLNCLLALFIVIAMLSAMTTSLAKLEEEASRESWFRADVLIFFFILLGPLLLTPAGNPGLLQYTLISLSGVFFASLVLGPQLAASTVILATVAQIVLVLIFDERWLPVFWDPSTTVIAVATVLAVIGFYCARAPIKRGEAIQWAFPTV